MSHQWLYTNKTSPSPGISASNRPQVANLVIINLGTSVATDVPVAAHVEPDKRLIQVVPGIWPDVRVAIMRIWQDFYQFGNNFVRNTKFTAEVHLAHKYFSSEYFENTIAQGAIAKEARNPEKKAEAFVHSFDTMGILRHDGTRPQWHPTGVGRIQVAIHLLW
ncbi:uncharacterized protein DNG_02822 [Cephalotrichum gorgonifer]|uniref:Uncharacterized protein n=1 Tax=Cephalotrichum gorgonifer TaxID=2041049 RepID=A0AAE8STM5_9PEZI|nr:uncharacterized protein DNG_02822 [Cephalotrichum gorgonifer]